MDLVKKSFLHIPVVVLYGILSVIGLTPSEASKGHPETHTDERPKAKIRLKPEPNFPREAEERHFEGTIVLRAIFRSTGKVTDIKFAKVIPENTPQDLVKKLSDECIRVAAKIEFEPATKNGHPVSMYVQLEYNFRQ